MKEGWIKIYRQVQDNRIWNSEPFSRGQAWIDLLLLANHKPGIIYVRDHKIIVERGQVGWSENKLAERWHWSRTKVRKFIKDLILEQQIRQEKNKSYSIITIENYDIYQKKEQEEEQQQDKSKTRAEQQQDTNKNVKNGKNEKTRYPFEDFWNDYDKKIDRHKCELKWNKISEADRAEIKKSLPDYVRSVSEKRYQKNPLTYLNGKVWKDDFASPTEIEWKTRAPANQKFY